MRMGGAQMPITSLKVALIDGPMYGPLYRSLEVFEQSTGITVNVAFKGTHPELNALLKGAFEAKECPFDLVSTHSKYAPSQAENLLSLDPYFDESALADFAPSIVELCRVGSELKSIPRNFDARLMVYRTDRLAELGIGVPETWEQLGEASRRAKAAGYTGLVYPGKGSGLFGTFFELLSSEDGKLFDERLQPAFNSAAGLAAVQRLRDWYKEGLTPEGLPEMEYDEVSTNFREGDSTFVTDWPGYFSLYTDPAFPLAGRFDLALTPAGSQGRRAVYCGSHSFAVLAGTQHPEQAVQLLHHLTSHESQLIDANHGHVPVRTSVMDKLKIAAAEDSLEARRLSLLEETIRTSVVIPPKFPEYPLTEDIIWQTFQSAIVGRLEPQEALDKAAFEIGKVVEAYR
ncbi:extracellular solute-binding protein [Cohnella terricola]|uniref:Extracellular solute-binding protein n=2 Tax=Cohnella terricola TaxID=1289167 RepID=A0A559JN28_9BACL|nr:extracellular solute-binding protein [Cohnella terricola]